MIAGLESWRYHDEKEFIEDERLKTTGVKELEDHLNSGQKFRTVNFHLTIPAVIPVMALLPVLWFENLITILTGLGDGTDYWHKNMPEAAPIFLREDVRGLY